MSETIKLLITITVDAPDVSPMHLDTHMESLVRDVAKAVDDIKLYDDGIIYVDWEDPKSAELSISVTRYDEDEVNDERNR